VPVLLPIGDCDKQSNALLGNQEIEFQLNPVGRTVTIVNILARPVA